MVRGWSTAPTWNWATTVADVGYNRVKVQARRVGSTAVGEWEAVRFFVVSPTLTVTTTPVGQGRVGQLVTFQGNTDPEARNWEYRFSLRGLATGNTWDLVQDYSPDESCEWTPPAGQAGLYKVQVRVRQVGSPLRFEERVTRSYTVTP